MSALMEGKTSGEPRKDAAAGKPVEKVKVSLVLPLETSLRLGVYAMMTGADRSEVVTRLIDEHLDRFVVHDLGASVDQATAGESAA